LRLVEHEHQSGRHVTREHVTGHHVTREHVAADHECAKRWRGFVLSRRPPQ
jgi:hypothetical protein